MVSGIGLPKQNEFTSVLILSTSKAVPKRLTVRRVKSYLHSVIPLAKEQSYFSPAAIVENLNVLRVHAFTREICSK